MNEEKPRNQTEPKPTQDLVPKSNIEPETKKPILMQLKPAKLQYNQKDTKPTIDVKPKPKPKMTEKTNTGTKPKEPKPKPEPEPIARPKTKPSEETTQKQKIKVKTTVVKPNDIKLFLEMKKRERELKLKPKNTSTIPPNDHSPSTSSTSATLVPPNNSLPIHAPTVSSDSRTRFSTELSAELSTQSMGQEKQRAHRGTTDKSGLI